MLHVHVCKYVIWTADKVIMIKVDIRYFNEALNCTVRKRFDGDVNFAIDHICNVGSFYLIVFLRWRFLPLTNKQQILSQQETN